MIVPVEDLGNEVGRESGHGPALFDRDGYVVGRGVLPQEPLAEVRREVIRRLAPMDLFDDAGPDAGVASWSGRGQTGDTVMLEKELMEGFADELLDSGILEAALERLWGRPPRIYRSATIAMSIPDEGPFGTSPHRDNGNGGPDKVRFWVPLAPVERLGGSLALAVGTHRLEALPEPSGRSPYRNRRTGEPVGRAPEDFGDWRATAFDVGDALLFRPDIVHASTANRTRQVRLAVPFFAIDARLPVPPAASLSNLELSRRAIAFVEIVRGLGATNEEVCVLLGEPGASVPTVAECEGMLARLRAEV